MSNLFIEEQVPIRSSPTEWLQRVFTYLIEDGKQSPRPISKEQRVLTNEQAQAYFDDRPDLKKQEIVLKTNDIYGAFYTEKVGEPGEVEITPENGLMMNKFFQVPAVMAFVSSGQFVTLSRSSLQNISVMISLCSASDPRPEAPDASIPILSGAPLESLNQVVQSHLEALDDIG